MLIALVATALAGVFAFGNGFLPHNLLDQLMQPAVIRCMLVRENKRLDQDGMMQKAQHDRIEKAAELEGISFEEALRRRKGFRYLY